MDDSTLHFARPVCLYAGAVVCVLMAWLFFHFDRRREAALTRLVHPRFRHRLMPGFSKALQRTKRGLWLFAVLLLCVAAAGPRKGYEWREVKRRGIDILFAVDTSRSMLAEDLAPNRLERARMGIHDFVERLEGDRIGLIPFAGSSYALCPLTLDYDAFRESLNALDTDLIPRQGTDVASAIREAERLFEEQGNNRRILVLITDGEDLQGDAIEAAEAATKNGMAIYPVGVGSTEGAVIPIVQDGRKDFVRDDAGNPVRTKLDEDTLKKIAEVTGGLYAQLGRGAEGLDTIYREKLRLVPKSEMDQRMEKIPLERFEWPLAAALLLLLMEFLLPDRRREAKARALPSAARRHPWAAASVPVIAAGVLLTFSFESVRAEEAADARVLYNQGTAEFKAGDFKKAAETLRSSLHSPDLKLQNRAYYNLGNSLYRIGQATMEESPDETIKTWEDAIKAYGDALALDGADEDARYNQELVKRKLEELKKKQQEQKKDDQNKDQKEEKKDEQKENEQKDQNQQDQEKKDQEKKDGGEQKQDQKKDGQKDQEQPNEEKKEGEQKPDGGKGDEKQSEKPDGEKKPEEKNGEKKEENAEPTGKKDQKDKEGKEGEKKEQPQPGKEGKEKAEGKEAAPAKAGEDKPADAAEAGKEEADKKGEPAGISEERRTPGEMTPSEARQLLQALRSDERTVIPLEKPRDQRRFRDPANTTKGKTW